MKIKFVKFIEWTKTLFCAFLTRKLISEKI